MMGKDNEQSVSGKASMKECFQRNESYTDRCPDHTLSNAESLTFLSQGCVIGNGGLNSFTLSLFSFQPLKLRFFPKSCAIRFSANPQESIFLQKAQKNIKRRLSDILKVLNFQSWWVSHELVVFVCLFQPSSTFLFERKSTNRCSTKSSTSDIRNLILSEHFSFSK